MLWFNAVRAIDLKAMVFTEVIEWWNSLNPFMTVYLLICLISRRYSCTAFAFGQTGSGKTYTMTGPPEHVRFQHNIAFLSSKWFLWTLSLCIDRLQSTPLESACRVWVASMCVRRLSIFYLCFIGKQCSRIKRWSSNWGLDSILLFSLR